MEIKILKNKGFLIRARVGRLCGFQILTGASLPKRSAPFLGVRVVQVEGTLLDPVGLPGERRSSPARDLVSGLPV